MITVGVLLALPRAGTDGERRPWWRDHGPGFAIGAAYLAVLVLLILP